ncbi:phospholipase [Cupriavidus pauculus]|uniref:1-phosphatidylinositol phosphodiesterase n=1 Tax=Cupriavidus pauculus TaxID=82633 RepID=A0A5P2HCE4_9BURK|nr:phospholipase [Cupriavidus pauculus]QET05752.1 phospholipase [Cupriavidus pauculus]
MQDSHHRGRWLALWLAVACTAPAPPVQARPTGAYSQHPHPIRLHPDWMSRLPDDRFLNDISIPGTHNSMSRFGGDAVATQAMPLRAQLYAGVRAFDIRVRLVDNHLHAYHGPIRQYATLRRILGIMRQFLRRHPCEVLLVRVRLESAPVWSTVSIDAAVAMETAPHRDAIEIASPAVPRLGRVRGRIVLFPERLYFTHHDVFDAWYLRTNWDLYEKWERVRRALDKARASDVFDATRPWGQVTYLSASGGAFPYFAASGQIAANEGASRLATGLTSPAFQYAYPDFPRVNCFLGICTIAFEGINYLTLAYLYRWQPRYVGVVMADFPGPSLIREIIATNTRARVPARPIRSRGLPAGRPPATDPPPRPPCLRG